MDIDEQVLDKGMPEGGMPGISGRQVPLADNENMIPGLLNGQGAKVQQLPRRQSCLA